MSLITKNFSTDEFERSVTATEQNIDNRMPVAAVICATGLCICVLEPLRELLDCPIGISSGYRSLKLNFAVHGADNSQHMLGQAADIFSLKHSPQQIFEIAKTLSIFDQLIWEASWVHISYNLRGNNRCEVLDQHLHQR